MKISSNGSCLKTCAALELKHIMWAHPVEHLDQITAEELIRRRLIFADEELNNGGQVFISAQQLVVVRVNRSEGLDRHLFIATYDGEEPRELAEVDHAVIVHVHDVEEEMGDTRHQLAELVFVSLHHRLGVNIVRDRLNDVEFAEHVIPKLSE